jgi:hypothetical protein
VTDVRQEMHWLMTGNLGGPTYDTIRIIRRIPWTGGLLDNRMGFDVWWLSASPSPSPSPASTNPLRDGLGYGRRSRWPSAMEPAGEAVIFPGISISLSSFVKAEDEDSKKKIIQNWRTRDVYRVSLEEAC